MNASIFARLNATIASGRASLGMTTVTQRTPARGTATNAADSVERQLQEDGHTKWGWIIYRCTYKDDEQWKEFLERIDDWIYETLEWCKAHDMRETLEFEAHENPEFDGATPELIQRFFMYWIRTQGIKEHGNLGQSQRYRYCLHADQEVVDSVTSGPEPPKDMLGNGYVNLVRVAAEYPAWVESGQADAYFKAQEEGENVDKELMLNNEDDLELDEDEDEPVEGWNDAIHTRIEYTGLMVNTYARFRHKSAWRKYYCAPPEQVSRFSIYDDSSLKPGEF